MTASAPIQRPLLALLIRLGAVACLATMQMLIKLASEHDIHLLEILFWRQFITLPIAFAWVTMTSSIAVLATNRPWDHARRAAYGMLGMVLNFGGVILLPLAEATTMGFTAPIWAVILSAIILREKVGKYRWAAVIAGFAGVLIIAQPGGGNIPAVGAGVALSGAFMVALISIQIADLNKTEKPLTIVFYFAAFSTPSVALALPFVMTHHSLMEWALLLGIGLAGSAGQLLLTSALRFGAVASVIVMDYSSLFWATIYGWLVWQVLPPAATWIGAPLIITAGLVIAWREHTLSRQRRREAAAKGT
ncbi:DMT family transporter [Altericroceibacterium endophyticum]|uniref:EamA family transporter n=1 Tax=Altericroceibacterium endophyticum TaxID=1808508 RepID=A0A6I4T043_9SPHN|nr:DMT family transporter [Altericroceibacterium endophyticum]MXO64246.1 EamA family transporter [Altericroceibacterium endophyticum]